MLTDWTIYIQLLPSSQERPAQEPPAFVCDRPAPGPIRSGRRGAGRRDVHLFRSLPAATSPTWPKNCIEEGLVGGEGFAVDPSLSKADANKQSLAEGSEPVDSEALAETRRSVHEYLDMLDEAAWGAASEVKPKFIARSDPAAQWTGTLKGYAFFAYATN